MKFIKPLPSTSAGAIATAIASAIAYMVGIDWNLSLIDWSIAINWLVGLTGLGAAVGYTTSDRNSDSSTMDKQSDYDLTIPLGLRVNNPGNLRPNGDNWQGMIGEYMGYVEFDKPINGLRAMARNLRNQNRLHGKNTIEQIITKYAPEEDQNNTVAYVNYVSKQMDREPQEFIDLEDNGVLVAMMIPMIRMENGQQPFSVEFITEAVQLA